MNTSKKIDITEHIDHGDHNNHELNKQSIIHTKEAICVICLERLHELPPKATVLFPCTHLFHWECAKKHIQSNGSNTTCPVCRDDLNIHTVYNTLHEEVSNDDDESHSNELPYPRVSFPLHTDMSCIHHNDVEHANENNIMCENTPSTTPQITQKDVYTLTLYTCATEKQPLTFNNYHHHLFYTDHILLEKRLPETQHHREHIDSIVAQRQQYIHDIQALYGNEPYRRNRRRTSSCCCHCVVCVMNHCCECLAFGFIAGITYGVIYAIKTSSQY